MSNSYSFEEIASAGLFVRPPHFYNAKKVKNALTSVQGTRAAHVVGFGESNTNGYNWQAISTGPGIMDGIRLALLRKFGGAGLGLVSPGSRWVGYGVAANITGQGIEEYVPYNINEFQSAVTLTGGWKRMGAGVGLRGPEETSTIPSSSQSHPPFGFSGLIFNNTTVSATAWGGTGALDYLGFVAQVDGGSIKSAIGPGLTSLVDLAFLYYAGGSTTLASNTILNAGWLFAAVTGVTSVSFGPSAGAGYTFGVGAFQNMQTALNNLSPGLAFQVTGATYDSTELMAFYGESGKKVKNWRFWYTTPLNIADVGLSSVTMSLFGLTDDNAGVGGNKPWSLGNNWNSAGNAGIYQTLKGPTWTSSPLTAVEGVTLHSEATMITGDFGSARSRIDYVSYAAPAGFRKGFFMIANDMTGVSAAACYPSFGSTRQLCVTGGGIAIVAMDGVPESVTGVRCSAWTHGGETIDDASHDRMEEFHRKIARNAGIDVLVMVFGVNQTFQTNEGDGLTNSAETYLATRTIAGMTASSADINNRLRRYGKTPADYARKIEKVAKWHVSENPNCVPLLVGIPDQKWALFGSSTTLRVPKARGQIHQEFNRALYEVAVRNNWAFYDPGQGMPTYTDPTVGNWLFEEGGVHILGNAYRYLATDFYNCFLSDGVDNVPETTTWDNNPDEDAKPKYLTPRQKQRCIAVDGGWALMSNGPDGSLEKLVAIPGLLSATGRDYKGPQIVPLFDKKDTNFNSPNNLQVNLFVKAADLNQWHGVTAGVTLSGYTGPWNSGQPGLTFDTRYYKDSRVTVGRLYGSLTNGAGKTGVWPVVIQADGGGLIKSTFSFNLYLDSNRPDTSTYDPRFA